MNSLKVLHFDENFNFNSYGLTVGNLFEHVGITLDKTSISEHSVPIISDKVLNQISEIAVIKSGMSQHPSAQKISANIFFTLQEYFNQNTVCINNLALKNDLVNMMGKYLIMQDVLECNSMKEIHLLASGLYDSIISKFLGIIRASLIEELSTKPPSVSEEGKSIHE